MVSTIAPRTRTRRDLCPGVLRPWIADDGALVRLRLVGGRLPTSCLGALSDVARTYGDGEIHLTRRANLQLRGMPHDDGALPQRVVDAITATGLLPVPSHELVRNLMLSPASGLAGGRADLRPAVDELDRRLCAEPSLADLPGRFLFVLDDGHGDLVGRSCDLGLVALDPTTVQVRLGSTGWGPIVPVADGAHTLVGLARLFLQVRGEGRTAPWHVDELDDELEDVSAAPDPRVPRASGPLAYGEGPAGTHVEVADGRLTPVLASRLLGSGGDLVVTPWHGVLVPREDDR